MSTLFRVVSFLLLFIPFLISEFLSAQHGAAAGDSSLRIHTVSALDEFICDGRSLLDIHNLKILDLSASEVREGGMKDIASIVKECTSLSTLALDGIQLNSQMIRILIQAARRHLTLKNISASGCSLSDDSMKSMAYLLRTNKKISKLNLSANEFTCEGLQFLQSTSPFSLEQLDISYNKIGNRGVSIISHLLRANLLPNLVRLELKQVRFYCLL